MSHINPISLAAMRREDVAPGVRFKWWTPGVKDSLKTGVFVSRPELDNREALVVSFRLNGTETVRTTELCIMGITPSSRGEWSNCLTVIDDEI